MEIGQSIIRLLQLAKEMESVAVFFESEHFSKTEFRLLREVVFEQKQGKKIIASELARRLGITRSAVSQLINKLEERGIVERTHSPTDRKISYVELTENANTLFAREYERANEVLNRVVEAVGKEKLNTLVSASEEFVEAFKSVTEEMKKA